MEDNRDYAWLAKVVQVGEHERAPDPEPAAVTAPGPLAAGLPDFTAVAHHVDPVVDVEHHVAVVHQRLRQRTLLQQLQHSTPLVVTREARSVEEKLEWVAAGEGFSVVPQSVAMYYQRADITWMVLTDVAPNEVRLAWPTAQHGRLIEDYLEAARRTVTG